MRLLHGSKAALCVVWMCLVMAILYRGNDNLRFFTQEKISNESPTEVVPIQHRKLSTSSLEPEDQKPARFLLGIFSMVKERRRRDLIRKALAMYNDTRICPLGSNDGMMPQSASDPCELIYTFVLGANPDGHLQVLGNLAGPVITKPPKDFETPLEPNDITFLNIKENMEDGKTPTWFNFASQVMAAHGIDYVIKCDSDTYVRVDKFLEVSKEYLPRGASLRYAGKATWSFTQNHPYMEGQFYVLSKDLAQRIGSMSIRYLKGIINIEDSDVGYFIMNTNLLVHLIVLRDRGGSLPWKHPLKSDSSYKEVLSKESRRINGNNSIY